MARDGAVRLGVIGCGDAATATRITDLTKARRRKLVASRGPWMEFYGSDGVINLYRRREAPVEAYCRKPIPSGEHARHVVELIVAAYRAARTGKTQTLKTTF